MAAAAAVPLGGVRRPGPCPRAGRDAARAGSGNGAGGGHGGAGAPGRAPGKGPSSGRGGEGTSLPCPAPLLPVPARSPCKGHCPAPCLARFTEVMAVKDSSGRAGFALAFCP